MKKTMEFSLDELAAEAVRLGRELERAAHAASLGRNGREVGYAGRTLRRLSQRDPFDPHDDASLSALEAIIQADLKSEVRGCERRFVETHYDDFGQHGELRDCPIYTERGVELIAIREIFSRFMDARAATLDRIAAERAVMRLLAQ